MSHALRKQSWECCLPSCVAHKGKNKTGSNNIECISSYFGGLSPGSESRNGLLLRLCVTPSVPLLGELKTVGFASYCLKLQKITSVLYST